MLVAFYHSEYSPTRLPSVRQYQRDVQKFVKLFPNVRQYQSWDEANRGNVRGLFSSPSPKAAAQYYPYYGGYPYSSCNPYYSPYGCGYPYAAGYGYPGYGYGYPYYGYGYGYGYPFFGVGFGFVHPRIVQKAVHRVLLIIQGRVAASGGSTVGGLGRPRRSSGPW